MIPRFLVVLLAVTLLPVPAWPQAAKAPPQPDETVKKASAVPRRSPVRPGARSYMGRPIAEVMSYLGADWLFRDSREEEEQPERMLDALGIQPGWTVADVGAGAGYTTLRLAQRVGPTGIVLASDVQPQMLQMLIRNVQQAGHENVIPILCTQTYTGLPPASVDLALLVDVYHEMSDPEASLRGLRRAIKPGGRLVLVEFRAEDPNVPIKPEHKMTVAQVRKEIEPKGFAFKESLEFLPWQHIIIFERPADRPARPAATAPER